MPIREHIIEQAIEWTPIIDCPFNGSKTNYADSGIVLSGNGSFVTDPVTGANQVAQFTSDSNRMFIELADFSKQDTGRCKIELDFLFYSHTSPSYPNIVDNGKSGNGGIITQRENPNWRYGITNKGYNVSQTPSFADQVLNINKDNLPLNTWMHLLAERYNGIEHVRVSSGNSVYGELFRGDVGQFNASVNPHMGRIAIGGSNSWGGRYLNGCIKNLKIWLHNEL